MAAVASSKKKGPENDADALGGRTTRSNKHSMGPSGGRILGELSNATYLLCTTYI